MTGFSMTEPTFSLEDLNSLKKALSSGVLRVRFENRETEYRSIDELKIAIDTVEKELKIRPKGPFFIQLGRGN